MKMDAFIPAIPELVKSLGASTEDAHRAAVAITTTDLVSKEAALQVRHEEHRSGGGPQHALSASLCLLEVDQGGGEYACGQVINTYRQVNTKVLCTSPG